MDYKKVLNIKIKVSTEIENVYDKVLNGIQNRIRPFGESFNNESDFIAKFYRQNENATLPLFPD